MAKDSLIFSKTEELFHECLVRALGADESTNLETLLSVILNRLKREEMPVTSHRGKTVYERAILRLYHFYNLKSRGIRMEDAEFYAYDEDDAARDMIRVAENYPNVKNENGQSYYKLIKKSVEGPRRVKPIISLAAIIAGIILIALVIIFKPFGIFKGDAKGTTKSVESNDSGNEGADADGDDYHTKDASDDGSGDYSEYTIGAEYYGDSDGGTNNGDMDAVVTFSYEEADGVGMSEIEVGE